MTWATLSHAEMAQRLRELLAADPPKPPRIIYAAPDGRHHLNGSSGGDSDPQRHQVADQHVSRCNGGAGVASLATGNVFVRPRPAVGDLV